VYVFASQLSGFRFLDLGWLFGRMLGRGCLVLERYLVNVKLLDLRKLLFSLENLIGGFRWRFFLKPQKGVVERQVAMRPRHICCS
jgi:hypothetical protein